MGTHQGSKIVSTEDNRWLLPTAGGLIGHVEHVNGPGAQPIENFVATRHELELIARYWIQVALQNEADQYVWQTYGSDWSREMHYAWRRVSKLAAAIGDEFIDRVCAEEKGKLGDLDEQRAAHEKWMAAKNKQDRSRFYEDVMRYVRGETCGLEPGTHGMIQAEIAKALIAENADLALPMHRDKLLADVHTIWWRDHVVHVTLDGTAADDDVF
jgi:hypothetical protein